MSKEKEKLNEMRALRYIALSGLNSISEEFDAENLYEPVVDAAAGGENLVNPIDHAEISSEESNVTSVEVENPHTGEVEQVSEAAIKEIARKIKLELYGELG